MDITIPDSLTLGELVWLITQFALLILVIVFILIGFRVLKLLGIAQELAESIAEIVETVNLVLWQPVRFYGLVQKRIKQFLKLK